MKTELPGNSSASIEFALDAQHGNVVKKTCRGNAAYRLMLQAEKQEKFVSTSNLKAPKIFEKKICSDQTQLIMEFVRGTDFVLFTNSASAEEFEIAIGSLIELVKREFLQGQLAAFPHEVWNKKVSQVLQHCIDKQIFSNSEIDDLSNFLRDVPKKILIGECHGDFTFSNVIVEKPDKLCVFDFLNPPFETPYEDAAKFLQDAQFHWSLLKHTGNFDKTRVQIYWKHAEKMLREELAGICDFDVLSRFQILGLLRIIPYTSDGRVIHFLKENILREVKLDLSASMRRRIF